MTISSIQEIPNENLPKKLKPVKEVMNKYIPNVIEGIPRRNGYIWVDSGSGGSGKTSLLLNMFKNKGLYRYKYDNIYYVCPESSFLSVEKHPFKDHDKIYHDLDASVLNSIKGELDGIKKQSIEDGEIQYNCVIIDDMADSLKEAGVQEVLNKMLIKARHLNTCFIFTLQSYYYFPKILRKQITNITIFKPKNTEEWESISKELLGMKKDDALILYDFIYDKEYNHLDIDTVEGLKYKNFNLLNIEHKK